MLRTVANLIFLAGLAVSVPAFTQQQKEQTPPPADSKPSQSRDPKQEPKTPEPAPETKPSSNADDNPFPEDISQKAAEAAKKAEADNPSGSAPSSALPPNEPQESSSSSRWGGMDLNGDDTVEGKKSKADELLPDTGHNTKLALKNDEVGRFYMARGDWKGAYGRFKESLALEPGDADAAFGLAEAAAKMNLMDEAVANYQKCLDLDPTGPKSKASLKALEKLQRAEKRSANDLKKPLP